ncbi:octanoyltransferase, partial [Mammaliicoccus sciuri]
IEYKPLEFTEEQLAEIKQLEEKYKSEEWTYRK